MVGASLEENGTLPVRGTRDRSPIVGECKTRGGWVRHRLASEDRPQRDDPASVLLTDAVAVG